MQQRKTVTEWVPFSALVCDPRVQRVPIRRRVRHLTETFALAGVGMVTVSQRADGRYYVIDGQHRLLAALACGFGSTKAKCVVYRDLTVDEEAGLFLVLNDARAVSTIDKYRVGLIAGDPTFLAIKDVLDRFGLHVATGTAPGTIRCVDQLLTLHGRTPELLEAVLATSVAAWGSRPEAFEAQILAGLGVVHGRYNGELDRESLPKRLAKYPGGPASLLGNARGLSKIRSGFSVKQAVGQIVVDTYNARRTGDHRLAPL